MLSCSCSLDYSEWYYEFPEDLSTFDETKRKRCCSCSKLVDHGSQCVEFERFREPYSEIEENIHGTEVQLASWFMCEWCGEMYFNLSEIGYCHWLGDSMKENLREYWEETGFKPPKGCKNEN